MDGRDKYLKFFRVNSPLVLRGEGSDNVLWMAESIIYIDFSIDELINEYFNLAYYTKGGFQFENMFKMSYKVYEKVIKIKHMIDKKREE